MQGLYAITDEHLIPHERFETMIVQALEGGAKLIQLRDKTLPYEHSLQRAKTLVALCRTYEALAIINDNARLAYESDAHGLHIGGDDGEIGTARDLLGDKIIGVSCYNDLARAKAMQEAGADYVAFGACFPSPTKPHAPRATLELLETAVHELSLPICAIGGITLETLPSLLSTGITMTAVISDLWQAPDITVQAHRYTTYFKEFS